MMGIGDSIKKASINSLKKAKMDGGRVTGRGRGLE
jgi:hypothetical protein